MVVKKTGRLGGWARRVCMPARKKEPKDMREGWNWLTATERVVCRLGARIRRGAPGRGVGIREAVSLELTQA